MVSLGDVALARDPGSALADISRAVPEPDRAAMYGTRHEEEK